MLLTEYSEYASSRNAQIVLNQKWLFVDFPRLNLLAGMLKLEARCKCQNDKKGDVQWWQNCPLPSSHLTGEKFVKSLSIGIDLFDDEGAMHWYS